MVLWITKIIKISKIIRIFKIIKISNTRKNIKICKTFLVLNYHCNYYIIISLKKAPVVQIELWHDEFPIRFK